MRSKEIDLVWLGEGLSNRAGTQAWFPSLHLTCL